MYAIEFKTKLRNDGAITVPPEFKPKKGETFRVIILTETNENLASQEIPAFDEISISTKNFKFNREEANER